MSSKLLPTEQIDRVIGTRVRAARNELSMSQSKLGEHLGVTFQQVQKYEKGTNRIAASTLVHIAALLNKPVTYFLDEVKYKPGSRDEELAVFMASREGTKLIGCALDLPPALRGNLAEIARNMGKAV